MKDIFLLILLTFPWAVAANHGGFGVTGPVVELLEQIRETTGGMTCPDLVELQRLIENLPSSSTFDPSHSNSRRVRAAARRLIRRFSHARDKKLLDLATELFAFFARRPSFTYNVGLTRNSASDLLDVEISVQNWTAPVMSLVLAEWMPGSYVSRAYSKDVFNVRAYTDSEELSVEPSNYNELNRWLVQTPKDISSLTVRYRVKLDRGNLRTNSMSPDRILINPAATFMHVSGYSKSRYTINLQGTEFESWKSFSSLKVSDNGKTPSFRAKSYSNLIESMLILAKEGVFEVYDFEVSNRLHRMVVFGKDFPKFNVADEIPKIQRVLLSVAQTLGHSGNPDLPFDRPYYLVVEQSLGEQIDGIESRYGQLLNVPATVSSTDFLRLVAHEYSHLWNGVSLRPAEIADCDCSKIVTFPSLWFVEGLTEYLALRSLLASGLLSENQYMAQLSDVMQQHLNHSGRNSMSLVEASVRAWRGGIYDRNGDEGFANLQIDYYLKGFVVSLLLDIKIRSLTEGKRSIEDFFRNVYKKHLSHGYLQSDLESELGALVPKNASKELVNLMKNLIERNERDFPLPLREVLGLIGLEWYAGGIASGVLENTNFQMLTGSTSGATALFEAWLYPSNIQNRPR